MSDEIKVAIIQNNVAAEYLRQGHHILALEHFESAAKHLHQIAITLKDMCPSHSSTSDFEDILTFKETCILKGDSFISSSPILLHEYSDNFLSPEAYRIQSATILFNMGLTCHLSFMRPNGINDALSNAMTLYEMACSLGLQGSQDEDSSQIVMAALNNMGELHHELGNFKRSKSYLEDLTAYILSLDDPLEQEEADERHGFMLNAMVLRSSHGAAAA
eukprot:CAMPEP_0116865180 /NCGR_PEP_ID=MMETSP0418-20121206/25252_1 /TAXON_ID=1158023 /ORGANISM="Astrosyne radiata, Strain 13vi08-1A" /LENGTH=217 /DNA_ID=CAMNT_0004500519 /DNA_START=1376 /DNA_END=2029 /DNA_ORIENTATION=+